MSILLEGGAARFPVAAADFRLIPRLPDEGGWALEWNREDLESPLTAGLRLLVNSSQRQLVEALRSGSTDTRAGLIRSFVTYDVPGASSEVRSVTIGSSMIPTPSTTEPSAGPSPC